MSTTQEQAIGIENVFAGMIVDAKHMQSIAKEFEIKVSNSVKNSNLSQQYFPLREVIIHFFIDNNQWKKKRLQTRLHGKQFLSKADMSRKNSELDLEIKEDAQNSLNRAIFLLKEGKHSEELWKWLFPHFDS